MTTLLSLLTFVIAVSGAPMAALDAATLLRNGQEAQALNRHFQGLTASDSCQDGQVACIGGKTLVQCQGTSWSTVLDRCTGKSQNCFALPSVSSSGVRLTCTSPKSAASRISATGATGGLLGNPNNSTMEVYNGNTTNGDSAPDNSPAPVDNAGGNNVDPSSSHRHPCSKATATTAQSTPTAAPDTLPSSSNFPPQVTTRAPAQPSPAANTTPGRITVTVTLVPSEQATLAPQTRTVSPKDAEAIVASIKAAGGSEVVYNSTPAHGTSTPSPTSPAAVSTITSIPLPSSSPVAQGNDGYY
ncbi:hypothetical protein NP233_g4396 [Leucocoprinus birnbaumii]|uniref:Carbohydrate-binding module family 19 domain-containing protein n=1 Tax=Leucocoprinus birnbaumii TaxID=56174 RepID=A0AAD5VXB8_9AGAR|nr:hypothetical protein NP233_g4396 [Leucocoprinus birnbaumii]